MTSPKLLNGFPCRSGGGRDCKPTFATISGCVAMVANIFERAPSTVSQLSNHFLIKAPRHESNLQNASCGLRFVLPGKNCSLNLWYAPYVILGFTTSTKLAFNPLHSPVHPSSLSTTSFAVAKIPFFSPLRCVCCLAVTTAIGIVNSCASAPATAPNESSAAVECFAPDLR